MELQIPTSVSSDGQQPYPDPDRIPRQPPEQLRDRLIADIRPWAFARMGLEVSPLTCHPYDICTALIAQELGVQITDLHGEPLRAPLDIRAPVGWIGYANAALRRKYEPVLLELLWG